jgi:hypothetical protein
MPKHHNRTVLTKQKVLIIIGILLIGVSVLSLITKPGLWAVSGLLGALLTVAGLFDKKQASAGSAMLIADEHGQRPRKAMLGRVKSMWLNDYEVTARGPALLRLTFQHRQDFILSPGQAGSGSRFADHHLHAPLLQNGQFAAMKVRQAADNVTDRFLRGGIGLLDGG